jgi:pimeloyl-ACP methyl ester carboxylesterase
MGLHSNLLQYTTQNKQPVIVILGFGQTSVDFLRNQTAYQLQHFAFTIFTPPIGGWVVLPNYWQTWYSQYMQIQILKPILLGYSMGGRIAAYIYSIFTDHFAGCLLLSCHLGGLSEHEKHTKKIQEQYWLHVLNTQTIDDFWALWDKQAVFKNTEIQNTVNTYRVCNKQYLTHTLIDYSVTEQPNLWHIPTQYLSTVSVILGSADTKYVSLYKNNQTKATILHGVGHRVYDSLNTSIGGSFGTNWLLGYLSLYAI